MVHLNLERCSIIRDRGGRARDTKLRFQLGISLLNGFLVKHFPSSVIWLLDETLFLFFYYHVIIGTEAVQGQLGNKIVLVEDNLKPLLDERGDVLFINAVEFVDLQKTLISLVIVNTLNENAFAFLSVDSHKILLSVLYNSEFLAPLVEAIALDILTAQKLLGIVDCNKRHICLFLFGHLPVDFKVVLHVSIDEFFFVSPEHFDVHVLLVRGVVTLQHVAVKLVAVGELLCDLSMVLFVEHFEVEHVADDFGVV